LRYVVALWLCLAAAAGGRTLLRPASHTVFPVFAAGAAHWWNDEPLYLDYKPLDYFRYPPLCAVFCGPFAALGLRAGGILWIWLGLGVYVYGLWCFRRDVLPADWSPHRETGYYALATLGAVAGVWNGQNNALVTGLLLMAAAALARGRDWTGAVWLAAAVNLKLTPLPAALLLCSVFPRRLAGRLTVAVVVLGLVPFLTRPPGIVLQHYGDWFAQQSALASQRWPGFRDAWTVWQVIQHSLAGDVGPIPLTADLDSPAYRLLQAMTAGSCLVWSLAQRLSGTDRRQVILRTLSIGAAWLMLFGPAVESPTYVFLAPFLAVLAVEVNLHPFGRALAIGACVLILLFGFGAISVRLAGTVPAVLTALPVATALYAAGLALAYRPRWNALPTGEWPRSSLPQRESEVGTHAREGQVNPQHSERLEEACVG
jgi:hypothetical protein